MLYRLKHSGYQAYLVGGGVRDLLLGREPKDFDVATDARPEQVRAIFRNCRLIGRRFRLAHVHFGREVIEVATFRGDGNGDDEVDSQQTGDGMLLRDNVYGSIEEDVQRRDFTVNALYYNVEDFSVVDYTGGLNDLKKGVLRLLGDPVTRYREDPVRMLRAVRFASKLGFTIDSDCETPLKDLGCLLRDVPSARLFDEVLKLFLGGFALQTFEKLRHYGLFGFLFPATETSLEYQEKEFPITFVNRGMENTDLRVAEGKPVTPAFLFAVLLWEPVRQLAQEYEAAGMSRIAAMEKAGDDVVSSQVGVVAIPKRFSLPMREIWSLQQRLEQRVGKRPHRLLLHPRFRAAYDFFLLRAESGETDQELAAWWTRFQSVSERDRLQMTRNIEGSKTRRRRPRRRRGRRRDGSDG